MKYTEKAANELRRPDRGMTEDEPWMRDMLHRAGVGVLAMVFEGQPFVNSNLFAYDEEAHAVYTHTARVGRTRANLEVNDRVCFSVSEMGRMLPAAEALEFSVEYAGVTLFGRAVVVDEPVEAEHGLQLLLDKYAPHLRPGEHYRAIAPEELKRTSVFKIIIESWSGKRKQAENEFPGAFFYTDRPNWRDEAPPAADSLP